MGNAINNVNNARKPKPRGKAFAPGNTYGKGRPVRAIAIPDGLRENGREPSEKYPGLNKFQEFCKMVYDRALSGDMEAVKFIADRTEGKVQDRLAVEGMETAADIVIMWPKLPDGKDNGAPGTPS